MPVQMEDSDAICLPLSPVIEMPSEYPEEDTNLLPCSICNRTFNPKSLERHEKVCQKVQTTKRNTFDPSKQRAGENAEALGSITKDRKNSHPPTKKKSRWREKHAEFLKTIRAARTTSDDSDEGSPQRLIPSDYIKCQHCDRYFGPKAADRHISWCEEQKNRLPSSRTNQDTQAIQRLKTRTKYTPPKPGQNGWRAPKKKDVISSIPPPNVGANIPPPGRLISPPPCSNRQFSPPPISYPHRTLSPSPSRRETLASLPPGGPSRYSSTSSLGRSSGKQFSTMLQSMTGCPTGYGLSTGYGSSYMYGSPNQNSHFNRSASLRLPRKRPSGAKRMARHRDLASDMLSSVSVEGGKRQEPEGGEDRLDSRRHYEQSSYKTGDAPYDPYCAAELQLQDLLGPAKSGVGGMRSDMLMGSTGSLKGLGLTKHALQHRDYSPHKRGLGSMSLCSFRLDTLDHMTDDFKSPGDESSELESLGGYSNGIQSPIDEFEDLLASLTTVNNDDEPKSEYDRRPESRNGSRSRTVSSQSNKSPYIDNDSLGRIRPDGSYSWKKSPSPSYDHSPLRRSPSKESSPPYSYNSFRRSPSKERSPPYIYSPLRRSPSKERTTSPYSYTPLRRSLSKEKSPIYQNSHAPTTDFEKNNRGHAPSVTDSNNYGWKNRDSFSSPQNFSRHLRKISPLDDFQTNKTSSLNLTRSKNILENKNYLLSRLNEDEQRVSSGSSTDSSLPLITSPMSSGSNLMEPMKRMSSTNNNSSPSANLPKFCYECGNKYPVSVAKFCCQCGAPRVT